jgi:hypothetical protein
VIPKKFASKPKGKLISLRIRIKVVPPPNNIEYNAAFDEGFFKNIVPNTGTNNPETINA